MRRVAEMNLLNSLGFISFAEKFSVLEIFCE